jgi:hypothetical protein
MCLDRTSWWQGHVVEEVLHLMVDRKQSKEETRPDITFKVTFSDHLLQLSFIF